MNHQLNLGAGSSKKTNNNDGCPSDGASKPWHADTTRFDSAAVAGLSPKLASFIRKIFAFLSLQHHRLVLDWSSQSVMPPFRSAN